MISLHLLLLYREQLGQNQPCRTALEEKPGRRFCCFHSSSAVWCHHHVWDMESEKKHVQSGSWLKFWNWSILHGTFANSGICTVIQWFPVTFWKAGSSSISRYIRDTPPHTAVGHQLIPNHYKHFQNQSEVTVRSHQDIYLVFSLLLTCWPLQNHHQKPEKSPDQSDDSKGFC